MKRRGLLGGALAAPLLARTAQAADDVAFALNWIISGRNAGYFIALEKGFYRRSGSTPASPAAAVRATR